MNRIRRLLACRMCPIESADENKRFPRICIGQAAFVVMGAVLVIIELTN